MATVPITEADLKRAMRDPRYWQSGHPEREDWSAWVTEGWQGLENGASTRGPGGEKVVRVRAYVRRRGGKTHHVGAYTQTRHSADGEGGDAPPGLLNVSDAGTEVAEAPGGTRAQSAAATPRLEQERPGPVLIFIGGLLDRWDHRNVGRFFDQLKVDNLTGPGDILFDWDERAGIEAYMAGLPPGTPVRLIGHSWGADTAAQIAAAAGQAGRPIDMLVTIDPVGRGVGSNFFDRVKQGAGRWININAVGGGSSESSNIVAGIGSSWNMGPMGHAHEFVNAPVPHLAFGGMMNTILDSGRSLTSEVTTR